MARYTMLLIQLLAVVSLVAAAPHPVTQPDALQPLEGMKRVPASYPSVESETLDARETKHDKNDKNWKNGKCNKGTQLDGHGTHCYSDKCFDPSGKHAKDKACKGFTKLPPREETIDVDEEDETEILDTREVKHDKHDKNWKNGKCKTGTKLDGHGTHCYSDKCFDPTGKYAKDKACKGFTKLPRRDEDAEIDEEDNLETRETKHDKHDKNWKNGKCKTGTKLDGHGTHCYSDKCFDPTGKYAKDKACKGFTKLPPRDEDVEADEEDQTEILDAREVKHDKHDKNWRDGKCKTGTKLDGHGTHCYSDKCFDTTGKHAKDKACKGFTKPRS